MKQRYKKPTGIPEQFIEATRLGWVDKRTGEVLESIPNLVERLADYDKYMDEMHERQEESDVDDIAPYGVSSFEVHNKSDSLKIQSEQEYQAHTDLTSETPKTEAIKEAPTKDVPKETGTNKTTPKPRGRGKGKGATSDAVGSNIVVR